MKQQINFRASDLTARQLEALMSKWGTSQTETLTVVIDRIYQSETKGKRTMNRNQFAEVTATAFADQFCNDSGGRVMNSPLIVYNLESQQFSSQSTLTPTQEDDVRVLVLDDDTMFGEYDADSLEDTFGTLNSYLANDNDDLWNEVVSKIEAAR